MGVISNVLDIVFDRPFRPRDLINGTGVLLLYCDDSVRLTAQRESKGKIHFIVRYHTSNTAIGFTLSYDSAFNVASQIKEIVQKFAQLDRRS